MKIITFGASTSQLSINKKLATFTANLFIGAEVEVLDLNHYEMPLFSVDREQEFVHSDIISTFISKLEKADLLIISLVAAGLVPAVGFVGMLVMHRCGRFEGSLDYDEENSLRN